MLAIIRSDDFAQWLFGDGQGIYPCLMIPIDDLTPKYYALNTRVNFVKNNFLDLIPSI